MSDEPELRRTLSPDCQPWRLPLHPRAFTRAITPFLFGSAFSAADRAGRHRSTLTQTDNRYGRSSSPPLARSNILAHESNPESLTVIAGQLSFSEDILPISRSASPHKIRGATGGICSRVAHGLFVRPSSSAGTGGPRRALSVHCTTDFFRLLVHSFGAVPLAARPFSSSVFTFLVL